MKQLRQGVIVALTLALLCIGVGAQTQRVSNAQVRRILNRIDASASRFRVSLDAASNDVNVNRADRINDEYQAFSDAVARLRDDINARRDAAGDAQDVLNRAARIDNFMQRNALTTRAQQDWSNLRYNLNQLAQAYGLPQLGSGSYGNNGGYGNGGYGNGNNVGRAALTGTYRLDPAQGDDPARVADRAARNSNDRQRVYDQLINRLTPPDQLAIDRQGRTVTIASTRAPQITFDVDGAERVETLNDGRTVRVRADFNGDQLIVSTSGDMDNQFTVTFDPFDYGRRLRVTRQISTADLAQPVTVTSVYTKTDQVARFDIYNGGGYNNYPPKNGGYGRNPNGFIIPNDMTLVATLNNDVRTDVSRDGDRFTMTVQQPAQYRGAILEGTLSGINPSGRISGRAQLTFNFDTIRMRDGRTYNFSGFVDNVRTANGDNIRVNNEGAVQDKDNQTNKTVTRAAIGTGIGAIIGAIAGGGKGAAIGAVLGAGAGAGSVYIEGRDNLTLPAGTEFSVRASSPRNGNYYNNAFSQ